MDKSEDVEVRPSATNGSVAAARVFLKSPLTLLGISVVLLAAIGAVARGASPFFWVVIFASGFFAGICVHYRLYLANTTLYVRSGMLGRTDFLARQHEIPVGAAQALQLCSVISNAGIQPYLLGLSREGRCAFTIASADHYTVADINRVANAAAIPVLGSWNDSMSLNDFNRQYPGALSSAGRLVAGDFKQGTPVLRLVKYALAVVLVGLAVGVALRSQGFLH